MIFCPFCSILITPFSGYVSDFPFFFQPPRFDSGCVFSQDPAISYIWSVKSLNGDQRRAILKVRHNFLFCFSFCLIACHLIDANEIFENEAIFE